MRVTVAKSSEDDDISIRQSLNNLPYHFLIRKQAYFTSHVFYRFDNTHSHFFSSLTHLGRIQWIMSVCLCHLNFDNLELYHVRTIRLWTNRLF